MADVEPMTDESIQSIDAQMKRMGGVLIQGHEWRKLKARLDQAEARGAWRKIDDEARSGSIILLGWVRINYTAAGVYGGEGHWYNLLGEKFAYEPDGYQPLPAPPRAGGDP